MNTHLQDPLACFPGGVVLVTAGHGDARIGAVARSFGVLSPASALVAWTIGRDAPGAAELEQASVWSAHVLAYDQAALAARSGTACADLRMRTGLDGIPVLEDCAATLSCRRVTSFMCEDSIIVVGRVVGFVHNDVPPLIRHDGTEAVGIDIGGWPVDGTAATTATSLSYLLGAAFFYLYGKMRDVGGRLGYNNIEMFVLTALGERGGRTRMEIETLLAYSAHPTSLEAMDDLEARGLIVSREPANGVVSDTTFDLTDAGLDVFEQFRRASVQVQAGMESLLGVPETVALRALLYRFTGKIDTGSPVAWL
jgi:3-hydroxy-9,10-secoandrosta-1,3,5(10)-triene-9,17-dione monooxygenase reductase component